MAVIAPFRALRPTPESARTRRRGSLRRRQRRGSPCVGERQSAEFSARFARRNRSAAGHRSVRGRGVRQGGRELRGAEGAGAARGRGRAQPVRLPPQDGRITCRPASPGPSRWTSTTADVIKKHEHTRRDKEDDRTRHIVELRAQTGPVFLTYRASLRGRSRRRHASTGQPPLFDFTAPDGVQHTIWRVDPMRT